MGVLQRIRNGSPRKTANKVDEPRVAQGLKVASLANTNNSQAQPLASATNLNPPTSSQAKPATAVDPFKPRQRQHPQPKFPPVAKPQESSSNNTFNNNNNIYASKIMADLTAVTQVYGPHANIYTDVLSISPSATQQEIREAFFCIRYSIYQQLSDEGDNNNPLSMEERKRVEQKMDAVSEAFQVLSDRNRRAMYDAMLAQQPPRRNGAIPASKRDSPRNKPAAPDSPLSIGQKRSIYRRQMNAQQRRPIQGAMNERKPVAPVLLGETVDQNQNEEGAFNIRGSSVKNKGQIVGIDTNAEVLEQKQVIEEASPTAVEDFDAMNKFKNVRLDDSPRRTSSSSTSNNNNNRQDDESPDADDRTYEDDSRTYDDDSRTYGTYDDESYYTYGDTTLGTYDDSTYVTYDDYDDQTYGTYDDQTYGTYEDDSRGKYSPGHKTKHKPAPILKGSSKKDNKKKSNRRVTVISHRGKGGETGGDILPGIDEAFEELSGTYKDFKDTLNQVGSAFILSPDDIDKMSDKIRDAQMELVETYEKQVGGAPQPKGKKVGKGPKPSKKKMIKN